MNGPDNSPHQPYYLNPIACRHREESRRMILRAAEMVPPRTAAILGGGACEEIPLAELLERFDSATLNDMDRSAIDRAVANLPAGLKEKLRIQVADLTGVTKDALDLLDRARADCKTEQEAIGRMAAALDEMPSGEIPLPGPFDLVVCSCVLSQLHFALTHEAASQFARKFPGRDEALRDSEIWKSALQRVARRMEDHFIENLSGLLSADGLLYLSESAQVCFLKLAPDGRWQTPGTYRMLRTKDLADYVSGRFEIVGRNRWEWVVAAPQKSSDTGRLFDVQALVLKPKLE